MEQESETLNKVVDLLNDLADRVEILEKAHAKNSKRALKAWATRRGQNANVDAELWMKLVKSVYCA